MPSSIGLKTRVARRTVGRARLPKRSGPIVERCGFIDEFGEQGVLASVCEADYGPVFASTIETIETTCDNFVPQG